jgi:putative SOS response-associated peptidase YedK
MFNRYALGVESDVVAQRFDVAEVLAPSPARHTMLPGRRVSAVVQDEHGARRLTAFRWGLIPFWWTADAVNEGHRLLHARAETIAEKPAFRFSLAQGRCVLPATGFFQTIECDGEKYMLHIRPRDGEMWSFAGLWDEWISESGAPMRTAAIVSTQTNTLLATHFKRMPAILRREDEAKWLDPNVSDARVLRKLLQPLSMKAIQIDVVAAPSWREQDDESLVTPLPDSAKVLQSLGLAPKKVVIPRRNVLRDFQSPDGQVFFKTKSFTRDDYTRWHPVVDVHEGDVFCDCPDFFFRHAAHKPDISTPHHWCKHLHRAVENCVRHGDLRIS